MVQDKDKTILECTVCIS